MENNTQSLLSQHLTFSARIEACGRHRQIAIGVGQISMDYCSIPKGSPQYGHPFSVHGARSPGPEMLIGKAGLVSTLRHSFSILARGKIFCIQ
jgi:hypothetical protein